MTLESESSKSQKVWKSSADTVAVILKIRNELLQKNMLISDVKTAIANFFESNGYSKQDHVLTAGNIEDAFNTVGISLTKEDLDNLILLCGNEKPTVVHFFALFDHYSIRPLESQGDIESGRLASSLLQMRCTAVRSPEKSGTSYPPKQSGFAAVHSAQPTISSSTVDAMKKMMNSVGLSQEEEESPKIARELHNCNIEEILGESYVDNKTSRLSSNALDVLALYIKGQKLLYTEAKTYCEQQLNFLMLPAIFISCVGSIFSFLSGEYYRGDLIIACLNGFNAFLLALISYLKLDAKAQAHKTSAYKFDKLESMCEFNSGKFMFFNTESKDIMEVVKQIEKEVKEIKETNQFILPESIRYEFSFTYSTNVFLMVKKIQATEIAETNSLANLMRQLNSDYAVLDFFEESNDDTMRSLQKDICEKEKKRDIHLTKILECREKYFNLDMQFNREIRCHIRRSNRWVVCRLIFCDWLKS